MHCLSPRYILFYQIIKDYRGAIVKCKESYEDSEVAKDNVTKQAYQNLMKEIAGIYNTKVDQRYQLIPNLFWILNDL